MITKAYITLLMVGLISFNVNSQKLIWEEEFNGDTLNENVWNFELGNGCPDICGWGNNEKQFYTKTNHIVKDGFLTIKAALEDSVYTSTRITTKDKFEFKHGKVQLKAKVPKGKGMWSAFWMLGSNIDSVGWPKCGEIDILEYIGKEPNMVFTSLHTQNSHGNTINTKKTSIESIDEGFHIYEANWTSNKIEFSVDGNLLYTFNPGSSDEDIWPFNQPFYLLLNLAVGGNLGGQEVDNSVLPQEYVIDYIKVYQ